VDGIAYFELRLAEKFTIRFAGEEAGEAARLVEEGLLQLLEESLGQGFLCSG